MIAMSNEVSSEAPQKKAVIYDVLPRGERTEILDKVKEKFGYQVVKVFVDWADVISTKGKFPKLSELLTLIHKGELKVDAVFVPSVRVFRNLDLFLFVKKVLEMNGVELRSVRRQEKHTWKVSLENMRRGARRNFLADIVLYGFTWVAGLYIIYILQDPLLSPLIIGALALTGMLYYKKTYLVRKRMLKKLEELESVEKLKGKRDIRFVITLRGVEVVETPY